MEDFAWNRQLIKTLINNSLHSTTLLPNIDLNKINPKNSTLVEQRPLKEKARSKPYKRLPQYEANFSQSTRLVAHEIDNRFADTVGKVLLIHADIFVTHFWAWANLI